MTAIALDSGRSFDTGWSFDTDAAGHPLSPLPSVRVLWRPEQFNRVTNGRFLRNTNGWSTTIGVNGAAATSITRITTDSHSGSTCASVVCTSSITSGVHWDFGSDRFYSEVTYGAIYQATGWIKHVSGSRRVRITLGSEGDVDERVSLPMDDITDEWQPFLVRCPFGAEETDVQLAITNDSSEAVTFRLDDVSVALVDCFSQLENGSFETDTTGWAGWLGGAIARSTAETFGGSACARITSSVTAISGAYFDLPTRVFVSGRTYRLRFGARLISGTGDWVADWYDLDGAADLSYTAFTATTSWQWFTADWTASADTPNVEVGIYHVGASAAVLAIGQVEVYEAIDDLGTDAGDLAWGRGIGTVGNIRVQVDDGDGRFDPRNAASDLYGLLMPGKRIWARALYAEGLYPLFHGTIRTIEQANRDGKADLLADDTWADFVRAPFKLGFHTDWSYRDARKAAIAALVLGDPDIDSFPSGLSRRDLIHSSVEDDTFFAGTDGEDTAAGFLSELDDATGSASWVQPTVWANMAWQYTTVDRATLTDTSVDFTVDEDEPFEDLTGVRVTDEALENHQLIPWQGYELLAPADADDTGRGLVARAVDSDAYPAYFVDADDPYLQYTDDEYGTDADHPELRFRYPRGWTRKKWVRQRRRGRKVPRRRKVHLFAFVPFAMASGEEVTITVDFAIPMAGMYSTLLYSGAGLATTVEDTSNPLSYTITMVSAGATTFSAIFIHGTPYVPLDDADATVDDFDSQAVLGLYSGPALSTPFIAARGQAQGLGAYRNWRYGRPRMLPTLVDHMAFPRTLTADVADHFTMTADRWNIAAVPFYSAACRWEVTQGGLDWRAWHDLEELPSHDDWFTLDSSVLDGSDVLAY